MELRADNANTRSSNFELLRIVAMLMIIAYHIIYHCMLNQLITGELFHHPMIYNKLFIMTVIRTFGPICNNVFLLISGYFMINHVRSQGKSVNLKKTAKKLVLQVAFSTVLIVLISSAVRVLVGGKVTAHNISLFNSTTWYVGYYLAVVVIAALFLNDFLFKLNRSRYAAFILALFGLISFAWSHDLLCGISAELPVLLLGVLLFSVGGFIRRYNTFENVRAYVFVLIIVLGYAFTYIGQYNITTTNIDTFIAENQSYPFMQTIEGYSKESVVPFVISLCLFELFRRIRMPSSRVINFLGSATFGIPHARQRLRAQSVDAARLDDATARRPAHVHGGACALHRDHVRPRRRSLRLVPHDRVDWEKAETAGGQGVIMIGASRV